MKTMTYGEITCTLAVEPDFHFSSEIPCSYERETIIYAVERYLPHSDPLRRACTYDSWHIRLAKGKSRRPKKFCWLVPAAKLELPGLWVRISGRVDESGGRIQRVELLSSHPEDRKSRKNLKR